MPILCGKEDHFKYFNYCEDCALNGLQADVVFYCSKCQTSKRMQHRAHKDQVIYFDNPKFTQPLTQLKGIIYEQLQSIKKKIEENKEKGGNFSQMFENMKTKVPLLKLIDEKEKLVNLLMKDETLNQLLAIKFWQGRNRTTIVQFQSKIKHSLEKKMSQVDKSVSEICDAVVQKVLADKFTIEWPQNKYIGQIDRELQSLNVENSLRKKEAQICGLVIKLFTSFSSEQLWATEQQCQQLIKRYPQSKVLYLSLIRINELLPSGHREIPAILKQITIKVDRQFESTDIYYYYTAMAEWELIEKEQRGTELIFFQLKNKRYYRLLNADHYIASLNKAIAIKQKPAYYISLGIGYIVKQNHQEALRVFKLASSMLTKRNDALDLNKFWAELNYNTNHAEFESIMESLETRTLQFITNICKYFKNSKNYIELVQCCEELISRQPERQNFKIQFVKSILSYSSTLSHFNQNDNQQLSRAQKMIIELKNAEEKQALKLQKRLTRLKAQNDFKNNNFINASQGFETLIRRSRLASGSDFYNYAATQFKVFMELQCTEEDSIKEAYQSINKALKFKPNNIKYKKLKFFVCSYMNLFNEAYKVYQEIRNSLPNQIDDKEYQRLIQYVMDNLQIETPGQ